MSKIYDYRCIEALTLELLILKLKEFGDDGWLLISVNTREVPLGARWYAFISKENKAQ